MQIKKSAAGFGGIVCVFLHLGAGIGFSDEYSRDLIWQPGGEAASFTLHLNNVFGDWRDGVVRIHGVSGQDAAEVVEQGLGGIAQGVDGALAAVTNAPAPLDNPGHNADQNGGADAGDYSGTNLIPVDVHASPSRLDSIVSGGVIGIGIGAIVGFVILGVIKFWELILLPPHRRHI